MLVVSLFYRKLTSMLFYPKYSHKDVFFMGFCFKSNCGNQWKIMIYYQSEEVNTAAIILLILAANSCWQQL